MTATTILQKYLLAGIIAVILLTCLTGPASGSVYLKNGTEISEDTAYITILQDPNSTAEILSIQFFYNIHCGACHSAIAYLDEYRSANPGIVISYHDLFNSTENRELFENSKAEYNRQYASVPIIFMGNAVLEGDYAIRTNFEPLVSGYEKLNQKGFSFPSLPQFTTSSQSNADGTDISIPLIVGAGLLDGINPCAFAVCDSADISDVPWKQTEDDPGRDRLFSGGLFLLLPVRSGDLHHYPDNRAGQRILLCCGDDCHNCRHSDDKRCLLSVKGSIISNS